MTFLFLLVSVHGIHKTVYLGMYLEERVEQLENLSVDHGRQIETVAKGLANLTVTVNQRFDEVDRRFDEVDKRFDRVDERFNRIEADVAELKNGQARLESTISEMQQTQQLILTLLQERLK